jgi:hypothetical protein
MTRVTPYNLRELSSSGENQDSDAARDEDGQEGRQQIEREHASNESPV